MIQRIQTVYLFLTAVVTGLLFLMPAAAIVMPGDVEGQTGVFLFYTSRYVASGEPATFIACNWLALALNVLATGLSLVTIFLYKKRLLQLRLCLVNIILLVGLPVLIAVQANAIANPGGEWRFCTAFAFPIVGIILTWMACRGIMKDITLLKSMDRIRS